MSSVVKSDLHFRIGHVLFIDIVGYSKLLITEQQEYVETLNGLVRACPCFREAEARGELLCLPTGDGMALVFTGTVETAVECALETGRELKGVPHLQVRMGVHSGPISHITDVNQRSNVAGAGINIAQRVMSRGDTGHILLSRHVAEDLEGYPRWRARLHDLGECQIKHGYKLGIVNCYTEEAGNSAVPQSLRQDVLPAESVAAKGMGKLAPRAPPWVLIGAAVVAIVALLGTLWFVSRSQRPPVEQSIAVLPFENLSSEKENAYFAGGIQDDVLTNLAKIRGLKVISRTSVMQYQTNPPSVREIGRALGVAAVLEGSVRREGNRVRIGVQLIDTRTDAHIWAEKYDREVSDVFTIQSDLARQIVAILRSKLSPGEEARMQQSPTSNSEAYLVYLQARDHAFHGRAQQAADLFRKATELDPNFALAFAGLGQVETTLYQAEGNPRARAAAQAAAGEALRLQPDLPEAHLALADSYYRGSRDYAAALRELDIARAGLPNDSDVFLLTGSILRRKGDWTGSISNLKKATALNPNDPDLWANLGFSQQAARDALGAEKSFLRGIVADPNFFMNHWLHAQLQLDRRGDLGAATQVVARFQDRPDPDGQILLASYQLSLWRRKYAEAATVLNRSSTAWLFSWRVPTPIPRALLLGQALHYASQPEQAHTAFAEAAELLETAVRENPADPSRHALLGEAYAGLGRASDAVAEGKRALELLPESQDALDGPALRLVLAKIQAGLGQHQPAIASLRHLLAIPAGTTPQRLQIDPVWDPLRSNSRFAEMLHSYLTKKEN